MNLTAAINVFLRQSLRVGGFPFGVRPKQPNKETIAAMLEAERIAGDTNVKHYSDVEEAFRELKLSIQQSLVYAEQMIKRQWGSLHIGISR